jgi:hypothetical protein
MLLPRIQKILRILLNTVQLQLFLNIVSLIIIAHWGLSLSYIAPLSNIIFSPFLTIFLLLSSLVFFLELLSIPNEWLIYLLEVVTHTWSKIMALADRSWCFNVSKPSMCFTICAVLSTCILLQSKHLKSPIRRISSLSLLLASLLFYLGYTQIPKQDIQTVLVGKKSLTIVYSQGIMSIIDHGALAQIGCTKGWLEFTLLPSLRQTYATDTITHLILLKPTVKTLQALSELCNLTSVKNSYLPFWEGTTPRNLGRAYITARDKLTKTGTFHRLGNKKLYIPLGPASWLDLIPQSDQGTYQTITFPNIEVTCTLSNKATPLAQA